MKLSWAQAATQRSCIKLSEESVVGCSLCFVHTSSGVIREHVKGSTEAVKRRIGSSEGSCVSFWLWNLKTCVFLDWVLAEGTPIKWVSVSTELGFRRMKYWTYNIRMYAVHLIVFFFCIFFSAWPSFKKLLFFCVDEQKKRRSDVMTGRMLGAAWWKRQDSNSAKAWFGRCPPGPLLSIHSLKTNVNNLRLSLSLSLPLSVYVHYILTQPMANL